MKSKRSERASDGLPGHTEDAAAESAQSSPAVSFPIVGIGASAGGLEAFTQLLKALPDDTGMAFVLVQHLAPSHASALAEILSRATRMPVTEVHEDSIVEPNHVYVIPPDRSMTIIGGALQLLPREGRGAHHPIDQFFRSLAQEHGHRIIGVVLSGTASDGTIGLEEIKGEGGITFAQDHTAQHEGMPHSAIASGCVDFVMSPAEIARRIVQISQHPYAVAEPATPPVVDRPDLVQVIQLINDVTGVDFTGYKVNTLHRRVTRRMVFQKMRGLGEYVEFLKESPAEVEALYQDILISVTSFFRDKESFEALKTSAFPRILKDRSRHDPVRIWTLGCSTGQEAYSLVMAFTEAAEAMGSAVPVQLFASDLNTASIDKARAGLYSKDIAQDVSPERLQRFFTEVNGQYRITKSIRDACVFSRHNVLADPPFSRIDLISCRNLLIYMEPKLQQRIMPTLHYALKSTGCLWLGGSETIGNYQNLFQAEDAKHRIYCKKSGSSRSPGGFPMQRGKMKRSPYAPNVDRPGDTGRLYLEADRHLLSRFAPPGVLVTSDLEVLQYRGDLSPFLALSPGKASLSLLKMLRGGLLVAVRAAILRAGKDGAPVRSEGLGIKFGGAQLEVAIEVIPINAREAAEGGFLILFDDGRVRGSREETGTVTATPIDRIDETDLVRLSKELADTREYLQAVIEQQEEANDDLQSVSEEAQSANEELQSTNEELETSKEEIQSSNEELATVNDELNNRNGQLHQVNDDLINLLDSALMAVVILGRDLRVRHFTPKAEELLNLIPTDVGRPLGDIKLNLDELPDLEPLLTEVITTASTHEREVRDKHGRWYSLRLRPYRTVENKIDGVVVMLVDVDVMKHAEDALRRGTMQFEALFDASPVGMYMVDDNLRLRLVSQKALPVFGDIDHLIGRDLTEVLTILWGDQVGKEAVARFQHTLETGEPYLSPEFSERRFDTGKHEYYDWQVHRIILPDGKYGVVCYFIDISERVRLTDELRQNAADLSESNHHKTEFLAMLAHELRNPLAPIHNALQILRHTAGADGADGIGRGDTKSRSATEIIERQVAQMVRLVDDLLEVSRVSRGKIELRLGRVEMGSVVHDAVETIRTSCESRSQELTISLPPQPIYLHADPARMAQVLGNLLSNACKFTDPGGHIWLTVEREGGQAVIRVRDNGIGIAARDLPRIFEMFTQIDASMERSAGGLGIGLSLVRTMVELHHGVIEAHSPGVGQGSEFVVHLPMDVHVSAATSPPQGSPSSETAVTPRRVLVVDDNRDSAESLAMLLSLDDHDVRTAHDGLEALDEAEAFRPDVVLLDIGLPKLNGYEVASRIREQPWGKNTILVAMTGWGQDQDRVHSANAGFNAHMVKPVDHGALKKLLVETQASTSV